MLRSFGRHVRQQFVGYLALFIALGGVSYAAITLPINSVGSKQIKRGAVKNSDLGKSAVTTGKVKNGSLLSIDFKPGQLVAGAPGATGAPGPKGDRGTNGTNGSPGVSGYQLVESAEIANPAGSQDFGSVPCPAGKSVLGGGVYGSGDIDQSVNGSYPGDPDGVGSTNGWNGYMNNKSATDETFRVYAICGVVQ